MSQAFLRITQDGVTSYIPDTKFAREFWAKQNGKVGSSRNSAHEYVTIDKATPSEVEFMTNPIADSVANNKPSDNTTSRDEQLNNMQMVLENQQALIQMLLAERGKPADVSAVAPAPVEVQDQKVSATADDIAKPAKSTNNVKNKNETQAE